MKHSRVIGQNIELLMKRKKISTEDVPSKLGFSFDDLQRIKEGRLTIDGQEIDMFADVLGVNVTELMGQREEKEYRELIHCIGMYHNMENKEKIIDYIDVYIGIEEAKAYQA